MDDLEKKQRIEWIQECEIFTINTDEYGFQKLTIQNDEQLKRIIKLEKEDCPFFHQLPKDVRIGDTIPVRGIW